MDGFMDKANALAGIIQKVGVPTFLVVVLTGLGALSYAGYIPNPLVTQAQFITHALNTQELHGTLIVIGKEEVVVLKDIQREFKVMRCERKSKVDDQLDCLSKLSRSEF